MKLSALILVLSLSGASSAALAHRDMLLPRAADGSLQNLPREFQPVRVSVEALGTAAPRIRLDMPNGYMVLNTCATQLIHSTSLDELKISGSWYHDDKSLPPYVVLTFFDSRADRLAKQGSRTEFVFGLRDAHLIRVQRFTANPQRDGGNYREMPAQGCAHTSGGG